MSDIPSTAAYFTISTTGCTCCRQENQIEGPFLSLEDARSNRDANYRTKQFASQYADHGVHKIGWAPYEQLPDGRLIIGDRIFQPETTFIGHPDNYYDLNLTYLAEEHRK